MNNGIRAAAKASIISVLIILLASCSSSLRAPVYESSSEAVNAKAVVGDQYIVQKGDTLYGIAFRYHLNFHRLGAANGLKPPYAIYPGDVLWLKEANQSVKATVRSDTTQKTAKNAGKDIIKKVEIGTLNKVNNPPSNAKWIWPVEGKIIRYFSADDLSKGVDIVAAIGTPVHSTRAGKVVYAGSRLKGYGKLIIIRHDDDYLSAYAHNRTILVSEGQQVQQGQTIAELGMTATTSPRLHFEIRYKGKPIDPLRILPKQ